MAEALLVCAHDDQIAAELQGRLENLLGGIGFDDFYGFHLVADLPVFGGLL